MPRDPQKAKEDHRLSGRAETPAAKVPTYQELLDLALDETFPASDPLAIGAAEHVQEPRTTPADARDWTLKPGAAGPPGQMADPEKEGRPVGAPCPGRVLEPLACEVDGPPAPDGTSRTIDVPAGACTIAQTSAVAVLRWESDGGGAVEMPVDLYRRLLADGLVERAEPS